MDKYIASVLERLGAESEKEKRKESYIEPGNRMLAITRDTGKFFSIMIQSINAKDILEVGTSTGYSTLWLAGAISKGGNIITIEQNPSKIARAKKNFVEARVDDIIDIKNGLALDIIKKLNKEIQFDFVLLDADKENLKQYFDLVLCKTRIGGVIAIDNMLYPEKYSKDMQELQKYIETKTNVESVTVPIGNGEEIILKISE